MEMQYTTKYAPSPAINLNELRLVELRFLAPVCYVANDAPAETLF